jgi:aspartate aminotransferase
VISKDISKNLQNASWIRKMFDEGDRLVKKFGAENVYDFSLGNPQEEPPLIVRDTLKNLVMDSPAGMHRYMSNAGYLEARKAVAAAISADTQKDFPVEHVVMTNGAAGGLNVVLKALLNPGDEVVIFSPFFVEYMFYIQNSQGNPVVCRTNTDDFQPDPEKLAEVLSDRTKAVIINSPNNPTGVIYSEETLGSLAEVLRNHEKKTGEPVYVVSDEPYKKIVYDDVRIPEIMNVFQNSLVVNSYSKSLGLAGERIGYVAVSPEIKESQQLVNALIFCQRTLGFVNAPALAQRLVQAAAGESVDSSGYKDKRDLLYNALKEFGFTCVKPQGAFYLFPRTPGDEIEFIRTAQEHNLLFVPGKGFGCPGHFRISYCTDEDMIRRAIPVIKKLAALYF